VVERGRLAARLEQLDGGFGDALGGDGGAERAVVELLRPAKTPRPRIVPGSPAPPATGGSGRLARVRGPGAMTPGRGT
jgi:hypothetical protein